MNPIFIKIGSIQIYWYSVILFIAFVLGCFLALKEAKKLNIKEEVMSDFFFMAIPLCLIGARIYYVLFNLNYYLTYPVDIFKVWEGGLAIHGGIVAGLFYLIYFTKKHNINALKMIDILVVSLIIGQIIGRWGNFMNLEAYGPVVSLELLKNIHLPQFIINGMYIDGVYHHPTFLYESVWNLFGLSIMLFLRRKSNNKLGYLTAFYLIWYGIGRFLIESLRTDSLMLLNLKIAQLVSLVMIVIGIVLFIYSKRKEQKYE